MPASYTITGTLETDRLVRLDKPVSLPDHRVRVTLEPLTRLSSQDRNGETLFVWLEQIHEQRSKLGIKSLTKAEIDAWIHEEREYWGD
jgi:hypothetical protein